MSTEERGALRHCEVWIADDDASIRFVLGHAIRESGADVREFPDAETLLGIGKPAKPAEARTSPQKKD